MIPDNPDLNHAFASLTVGTFSNLPELDRTVACELVNRLDTGDVFDAQPKLGIAFNRTSRVSLSALITRVERELATHRHALFDGVFAKRRLLATKLLCLAVACSASKEEVRPTLNIILESITESELNLFAILMLSISDSEIYKFGDFSFGRLNANRLEHVCEHAGSDYFQKYGSEFKNCTAVMRRMKNVRLIDFNGSRLALRTYLPEQEELARRLLDDIHSDIAEGFWEQFRSDMVRQQALMSAVGVGSISPKVFWQLQFVAKFVAVFTRDLPGRGWVVPNTSVVHLTRANPSALEKTKSELSNRLRLDDWGTFGLDDSIQLYCEYLHAAAEHEAEGRVEEALLHTVFALDLLLGGEAEEPLSALLADRAGLLSYRALEMNPKEIIKFIKDTYSMRSRYVHRGERGKLSLPTPGMTLLERYELLQRCSTAILAAACWTRRQPWCQSRDNWLARLDVLKARHKAGDSMDEEIKILGLDRIKESASGVPKFVIEWEVAAK